LLLSVLLLLLLGVSALLAVSLLGVLLLAILLLLLTVLLSSSPSRQPSLLNSIFLSRSNICLGRVDILVLVELQIVNNARSQSCKVLEYGWTYILRRHLVFSVDDLMYRESVGM